VARGAKSRLSILEINEFKVTRKTTSYSIKKGAIRLDFTDLKGNSLAYCEPKKGETEIILYADGVEELLRMEQIKSSESPIANGIFDGQGNQIAMLKSEKKGSFSDPMLSWTRNGTLLMTHENSRNKIILVRDGSAKATIDIKGGVRPRPFVVKVLPEANKEDRILTIGMIILLQALYM
jgi:hypothetical protein